MKLTILFTLLLAVQLSYQNRSKKILMYKVTNNENIEIVDKLNKVSFNGQQSDVSLFKPDPRNVNNKLQ